MDHDIDARLRRATRRLLAGFFLAAVAGCAGGDWNASGRPMDPFVLQRCTGDADGFDTPPSLVEGDAPIYPALSLYARRSGSIRLQFDVLPDGSAANFESEPGDEKYFVGHAVLALKDWRLKPAMRGGRPVSVRCRLRFKYEVPPV